VTQLRGLFTFNRVLHAVRGETLYRVDSAGAVTSVGEIDSIGGPVDMEANVSQLCITDGTALYVYDGATVSTAANWSPGARIAFIDQRIVGVQRNSQRFGWTALGNAKTVAALDFFSAEGSPDNLVSILSSQRELLLLGETTSEVWYSVGGTTVFRRADSEFLQYGCAAAHAAQMAGDTPVWLGRSKEGQAMVLAGRGQRISTRAIEERFEALDLAQARAFAFTDGGHRFYCLNIPRVDTTLVYDMTFGQWHERAELVNGAYRQWRPRCHAFAYGRHWFGDNDGNLYRSDPAAHTIAGSVLCRDRISPVISQPGRKRLRFPGAEMVCDKGAGGQVLLRWSDDNGATWSAWRIESAGAIGKHGRRVRWNRLGSAEDRVFQIRMTDDAPWNPVSVDVEML
jgi:hypothetical protein